MRTIAYGPLPEHRADLHLPDDPAAPVLVYFHGGGLEAGERTDNPRLLDGLVAAGVGVVAAGYRLYPHARYPDFLEDAAACVAWVAEHLPGVPLLVGGSSAGAYLAMMLRFDPRWLAAHDMASDAVGGWFFDAGQPTTHYNILAERGTDPRCVRVDEAAPIFHVGPATTAAPTLFVLAEHDVPGRAEQTDVLLATLRAVGAADGVRRVVLEGYEHSGYLGVPDGQARMVELVADLAARAPSGEAAPTSAPWR